MKTLHTIYTNFAKRVLMALALITMGVSTAWGEGIANLPVDYDFSGGKDKLPVGVKQSGLGNDYAVQNSPYLLKFDDTNDYIQVQVDGAVENIIFEVKMLGGNSTSYFQLQGSSNGTSFTDIEKFTISGAINDVKICKTSANIEASYRYFKFVFTKGANVGFGKLQIFEAGNKNCNVTYDFTDISGFSSWNSTYWTRTVTYSDAIVTFESANRQTQTITNQPVTKGKSVSLVMTDASTLSAVTWVCKQWQTKAQTITLHYSTDGGKSYTTTGVTSSDFTISSNKLPEGTNAVKITFNNSSNQVGITSCSIEKVCGPIKVTVTLNPDGGTGTFTDWTVSGDNYTMTVDAGTEITLPELSKTGYNFDGWHDGTKMVTSPYTPTTDITLTAKWTAQQYNIIYKDQNDANFSGNHQADYPTKHTYGTATTLKDATKTGYTFGGWYDNPECTGTAIDQLGATSYTDNITLYAKWRINSHKVTWKLAGGKIGESTADIVETYNYGATISKPDDPTRDGFNFAGWKEESTNEDVMATMPDNDLVYIAQWTAKRLTNFRTLCTYEIILDKNGGTTDGSALVTASKTILTAINPPVYDAGHQIAGYYAEPGCTTLIADVAGNLQPNTHYTNANGGWIAGEVILYPKWEALEYTVTWKVGDEPFATSTVSATQPLALPDPAPTDDVLGCCAEKFIGWSTFTTPTKAQVFSDLANAPAITGDQTFHAVFATPVPGAGNSLVTFNEMGYANEEAVTSVTLGDGMGNGDATITFNKGTAATYAPTYYNIGEAVRTYAGNTITVAAPYANTVLTQIDFAFAKGENANAITASTGTITDGVWTGNAQSVTFTIDGATGHRRIASVAITTAVTGDQYTNYVTKCDLSGSASIGAGTITYANSATAIDAKCGQRSPASKAAMLTFASAQDLTCPVTIEASAGFLVSTNKNDNSKYASSITVKPVKTGANKGKLPTVYVRAEANFGASGQINGTITVTGSEITETIINVLANVTCTQYTLTVVNHLGETISTAEYYEGVEVAKVDTPATDDCSKDYTFDGWSTDEVTYGSLAYNKVSFPLTMPAENVKLYPVYECNKTADYHRVTYDLGAENWEGDYVIAYYSTLTSELIVANGKEGGVAEGGIGYANNVGNLSVENDIISKSRGNQYYVTLEAHNTGYLLKTQDGKYNYHTTNSSTDLTSTVNASTAAKYLMYVNYSVDDIQLCLSGSAEGSKFRYYLNSGNTYFRFCKPDAGHPIRLYKKSPLYTTPLICGTIEAEDAVVTSTAGQTIKVNVPITITSTLGGTTHITAESDNDHFTVTPLENVSEGEHAIAVHYTPTATTDGTETANITLTASHGNRATTTFQVTGRHLPENFVIAAKWGENWYVLPADMTSESITEGLLIEVNEPSDPTKALAAPNTTKYGLKSVYTSNSTADRYADNGEKFVFVENITGNHKTLYNGGGDAQNSTNTNIQVYAQYKTETGGYYETNPERYEWIPTTTNLKDYTLTSVHAFASEAARTVSLDNHGVFGTLLQDKSYNGMVRLLPVDDFYEPIELQVVEWKQNSVSVMYTGAGTKYTTQVGNNAESSVQTLSAIDHAVYELTTSDLTTATNQPLIISIQDNANATIGVIKLTIPAIVATDKNSTALGVTEENAKATSIVVLDGATLTADATKYTYDDITVYPGGNLIIDDVKSLGMYTLTLRAGSSWGAEEYEHKYPQFLLRGDYSNTSAQINLDYVTTQDYYYPLSVPEEVTIGDIKYPVDIYGNNVKKANTGSFQLKYYDGAQRATGATGWVVLDEKNITKLSPNSGYAFWGIPKKVSVNGAAGVRQTYGIHRIPIKIAADKLLDHEKINEEIAIQAYAAARPNDQGWNYLGNPYLAGLGGMNGSDEDLLIGLLEKEIVDGQWTGGWVYNEESVNNKVRYITITNDCQNFEALPVANAKISPFTTFFIQAASVDDQKICLTVPASVLNVSSLPARHYAAQQEAAKEITTGILLTGNDQTDRTGLLIADNFTEEYDFNADLSKFENSGINLYTIGKTGYLAYMAINQALAEQPISVGYTAPAEGLYTIAFDEDRYNATDISALYLIDYESNEKTNLLLTDYSFVTAAGTNNQRFALQVAFVPANSTNVEWVGDATIQVGVEGTALIINNLPTDAAVHVFDALGRLMYHIPHAPIEMQLTLPTGYYLVRIADKQNAVVTNIVIP